MSGEAATQDHNLLFATDEHYPVATMIDCQTMRRGAFFAWTCGAAIVYRAL